MKKLIAASFALLLIGCGLAAGGAAAGGELYGAYYNGSLHSVRDTLDRIDDTLDFNYHIWRDRTGWHSGWFDRDDDAPHFTIGISDMAVPALTLAPEMADGQPVTELDFRLRDASFMIVEGDTFSVSSNSLSPVKNRIEDGEWALVFPSYHGAGSAAIVITLPKGQSYEEVFLSVHDGALSVDTAWNAEELNLAAVNSEVDAGQIDAEDIDFNVSQSELRADFVREAQDYHIEAKAAGGNISVGGEVIAGTDAGIFRTAQGRASAPCELDLKLDGGTIDITVPS